MPIACGVDSRRADLGRASTGLGGEVVTSFAADAPTPDVATRATRLARSPHAVLAVSAILVLVCEGLRGAATLDTSAVWPLLQALIASCGLLVAWLGRDRLRLTPILVLGAGFQLAWIFLHLRLGVAGDHDPVDVYPAQGDVLLHGDYPDSEYPPGAVALFALETWLGGGAARTTNALLMVPFQLVCVYAVWSLRTRWAPWLATFVALWPLNAFYWEFRFDLVPAAALAAGLALAWRERWYEAGFVLGLGTVVKWTPALAFVALLLWLLCRRKLERAGWHLAGFAIPLLVVNVPLLLWKPSEVVAAYTTQGARTVTAESFVYLPLHLFWDASPGYWYFGAADVSDSANRAAVAFQLVVVALVVVAAALARTRASAVALAGLAPAFFLLANRIFSPQFFVLVLVAVVVASALTVRRPVELLAVMGACAVATTADTVLFQTMLGAQPVASEPRWLVVSVLTYVPVFAAGAWLVVRAVAVKGGPTTTTQPPQPSARLNTVPASD